LKKKAKYGIIKGSNFFAMIGGIMKKHLSPGICSITYGKRCTRCKHRKFCRQHSVVSRIRIVSLMVMIIGILFISNMNGKQEKSYDVLPNEKKLTTVNSISWEISKEVCDTSDDLWIEEFAEASDKEEHTEEVDNIEEECIQTANRTVLSEHDIYLIEALVYNEARGECFDGKAAVAATVLNRVENGYWGDTVESVLYAPYQFSNTYWVSQEEIDSYPEIEEAVMAAIEGYDPYYNATGMPVLYFYSAVIPLSESEARARAGISDQVLIGNQWYYNHW
jgi:hypothetical protein